MQSKLKVYAAVVAVLSFGAFAEAHAQKPKGGDTADQCYGYSLIGCVPWKDSVNLFQQGGRIKHRDDSLGAILAFCSLPLVPSAPNWNTFIVLYKDPDGTGEDYRVQASVRFVDNENGNVQDVVSLDSNAEPEFTGVREMAKEFTHDFDPNNYYWIQLRADRNNTAARTEILGFQMCNLR